ncbi:alpha-1D adrenergic receptor-like [Littorina saxatilis]|uniref:G-protein coupled receptors family 1 profile domain-containing protein n=1 Tax=Littorina saxatilis TaxID=31220 RepID=A0AAN9GDJ8_9CAEN
MNTSLNNTTLSDPDGPLESRSYGLNVTVSFLIVLIAVMGLVGNILVIFAVFMYHRLRDEVSNLFIVNLSITDLSSAFVVMVSSAVAVGADRWPMGRAWCSMVCGANYCFIIVSMLTLSLISLDRYMAIHHSLRYHVLVTKPKVLVLIAYTWLQGFAFGLAPILCGWVEYDYWEVTCAIQWHRYGNPVLTYVIVAFVVCFMLPGVVLSIAYCKVFRTAKKIKPRPRPAIGLATVSGGRLDGNGTPGDQNGQPGGHNVQVAKREKVTYSESSKAVRSLLIVVLAFFICMTPFSVTKLYKVCVPVPDALPGYANILATFFQFMSSAVNPLIYGLFRRDFQKAFLYLLWRSMRQHGTDSMPFRSSTLYRNSDNSDNPL